MKPSNTNLSPSLKRSHPPASPQARPATNHKLPSVHRRRGAPLGDKNALKHGFYTGAYHRHELLDLNRPVQGRLQDETSLLKVLIDRTARQLLPVDQTALSFGDYVLGLHVVTMAISRLDSFYHTSECLSPDSDSKLREFCRRLGFSEDEVRLELYGFPPSGSDSQSTKDQSAAHLGNTNALKYGFYASVFKPDEIRRLELLDKRQVDDEIALLRILIKRTVASMEGAAHPEPTFVEKMHAIRVITFACACLQKLERTRWLVFNEQPTLEGLINRSIEEVSTDLELR
jgi:hypothetical protein